MASTLYMGADFRVTFVNPISPWLQRGRVAYFEFVKTRRDPGISRDMKNGSFSGPLLKLLI